MEKKFYINALLELEPDESDYIDGLEQGHKSSEIIERIFRNELSDFSNSEAIPVKIEVSKFKQDIYDIDKEKSRNKVLQWQVEALCEALSEVLEENDYESDAYGWRLYNHIQNGAPLKSSDDDMDDDA